METFVHVKYAMATFVRISNISAVTSPILTKLFGPAILSDPKKFQTQNISDPTFFYFFGPKIFFKFILNEYPSNIH